MYCCAIGSRGFRLLWYSLNHGPKGGQKVARLVRLNIQNFRGIKELSLNEINKPIICLVGRGDSGKTTILEAIASVLSPNWNLAFSDTDFFNCDVEQTIQIVAYLTDFPEKLMSEQKFGLYIQKYNASSNEVSEELFEDRNDSNNTPLLCIKLSIDKTLEPKWVVTSGRQNQEDIPISASDRALLNCFLISDYVDRHFVWNKGTPLYSLLKVVNSEEALKNEIITEAIRQAKRDIDQNGFEKFEEATASIIEKASLLGLDLSNITTTLDFRDLQVKEGRVSLHDQQVPLRLKGKGSRRLASLSIQLALLNDRGILLVDEIEQGLEPDRARQAVRTLKEENSGQIFITTHSRDVLEELNASDVCVIHRDSDPFLMSGYILDSDNEALQKAVRACSEAFFAKKIIVCEGATEVGVCRALDKWRKLNGKKPMSFSKCAYVDGGGENLFSRADELRKAGFCVAVLCDSDRSKDIPEKERLKADGIQFFDCELNKCFEAQVFSDMPWEGVRELLDYACKSVKDGDECALKQCVEARFPQKTNFPVTWKEQDSVDLRKAISSASVASKKEWFKRIDRGEMLGEIIFKHFSSMGDATPLKKMLCGISEWVDL